MNLSKPFIMRPIATVLLAIGIALAGIVAFKLLPVAPLPQVDFPTISVSASLPVEVQKPWQHLSPHHWNVN